MRQVTWTDFKKLTKDEILAQEPLEVMFNGERIFRVNNWHDPRFPAFDYLQQPLEK